MPKSVASYCKGGNLLGPLSHPLPSCKCSVGGQLRGIYWTDWMTDFFPVNVFSMQASDSGQKRRSSLRSDPAPPHLPHYPSLHPFLHQQPCLLPSITIIPVICVTQSSKPVILRKSDWCESEHDSSQCIFFMEPTVHKTRLHVCSNSEAMMGLTISVAKCF